MGKTIVEKIISRALGRDPMIGEYVEVSTRLPVTMGMMGSSRPLAQMALVGSDRLFNPAMIHMVDGHSGVTGSHSAGESRSKGRAWAKKMGIPNENIYDIGRSGVEHVVSGDNAWAVPGEIFHSVAVNGHATTLGALGAFAFPLSFGSSAFLVTGKTWIRVPESIKIVLKGKLPDYVVGRDVSEYVLGQIGSIVGAGKVLEWTGPVIDAMSIDSRFTICCNALFFGAWTAIMNPDQKVIDYVKARNPTTPFEPLVSDPDANYFKVYEFDLSNLEPQIVPPPERYHVHPVKEYEGRPVNRGYVGTCENGRIEDLRIAAKILKGRKIHPDAILNITPATVPILKQAVQEGLIATFIDAEAVIAPPACGMCSGRNTPLASGDVCVSSSTCNYPGRMGSKDAEIYLGSPATVVASCVEGKITDPRKYL